MEQEDVDVVDWGQMRLDNLGNRVAGAAARFQPRPDCFRQDVGRSDKSVSLSQILSDVKDLTR